MNFDIFAKPFGKGLELIAGSEYTMIRPPFVDPSGTVATLADAYILIPFTFVIPNQEERDKVFRYLDEIWEEIHHKLVVSAIEKFPNIQIVEESFTKSKKANMLFIEEILNGSAPYRSFLLQRGEEPDMPETFVTLRLAHSVSKDLKDDGVKLLAYSATEQWATLPGKSNDKFTLIKKFVGSWEI
jgi:hypothetical protein